MILIGKYSWVLYIENYEYLFKSSGINVIIFFKMFWDFYFRYENVDL